MRVRHTLLVSVLLFACGHGQSPWHMRRFTPCATSTGDALQDRERTYLAALLALDSRHYGITVSVPHERIEATYTSSYGRGAADGVTWQIGVAGDASMSLEVPPSQPEVGKRARQWADKLEQSLKQFQCRTLEWLRWESQGRGLVAPVSAGGEGVALPVSAPEALQPTDAGVVSSTAPEADAAPAP